MDTIIDASIRGTLFAFCLFFWGFGLITIWTRFIRVAKMLIHQLFQDSNCSPTESDSTDDK